MGLSRDYRRRQKQGINYELSLKYINDTYIALNNNYLVTNNNSYSYNINLSSTENSSTHSNFSPSPIIHSSFRNV